MAVLSVREKLAILSDAAKYDASCASSGAAGRNSLTSRGIGSTEGMGICHSYAPDGRCISLLKILLTNFCIYDCSYCINRSSSNVRRARFSVDEVGAADDDLLSPQLHRGPVPLLRRHPLAGRDDGWRWSRSHADLREDEKFGGYIHLKTIPESSPDLIDQAGRHADRLSINVELPTDEGVKHLAPEKRPETIRLSMANLRSKIEEKREPTMKTKRRQRFAPAGNHADDHRRRRDARRRHPADQRAALRQLPSAPRLLFRLQPDPGFVQVACR